MLSKEHLDNETQNRSTETADAKLYKKRNLTLNDDTFSHFCRI